MPAYSEMTTDQLRALEQQLAAEYDVAKHKGIKLNMARGKPAPAQLDLSLPLLDEINSHSDLFASDGTDCRNYGVLAGIPEARAFFADILGIKPENVIVGGNASLAVMHDALDRAYTHGVLGSTPWCKLDKVRWLCPVPGYDRHFTLVQHYGFEMISIPMTGEGPDMDLVEKLAAEDPAIKGIWCVPQYSNPTGETYSEETVRRLASMKTAADDFRIFWDNAYIVHHLYEDPEMQGHIPEMLSVCAEAGNPDRVYEFTSTSKVTLPGAGISCMAASEANVADTLRFMGAHTIGYDKINQLRHVRFLKDAQGTLNHMMKHAAILRPKFKLVDEVLERELGETGVATWTKPLGGYFVSFNAMLGTAKEIGELTKAAGLTLTTVGATYPGGVDPQDSNIRIAPSYPTLEELAGCMDLFVLCVKLASVRCILASRA